MCQFFVGKVVNFCGGRCSNLCAGKVVGWVNLCGGRWSGGLNLCAGKMVGWVEFVCVQGGRVWVGKVDESGSICVWPRWTGGKADGRVQLGKAVWASSGAVLGGDLSILTPSL